MRIRVRVRRWFTHAPANAANQPGITAQKECGRVRDDSEGIEERRMRVMDKNEYALTTASTKN